MTVFPALRAELTTAVADAPQVAWLLTGSDEVARAHGHALAHAIQVLNDFLSTHRTASRKVRLYCMNLRHALTVRQESDELAANPAARKEMHLAAERLARKAQSGFASPNPTAELVAALGNASLR